MELVRRTRHLRHDNGVVLQLRGSVASGLWPSSVVEILDSSGGFSLLLLLFVFLFLVGLYCCLSASKSCADMLWLFLINCFSLLLDGTCPSHYNPFLSKPVLLVAAFFLSCCLLVGFFSYSVCQTALVLLSLLLF